MSEIFNEQTQTFRIEEIREQMTLFRDNLDIFELPKEEYVIIGGANLVLRGIKEATRDIDMLVSNVVFEAFKAHPKSKIKPPPLEARLLGASNESVIPKFRWCTVPISMTVTMGDGWFPMNFEDYRNQTSINYYSGNRLVPLDHVWESKQALQRPTDSYDLVLIADATNRDISNISPPRVKINNFLS